MNIISYRIRIHRIHTRLRIRRIMREFTVPTLRIYHLGGGRGAPGEGGRADETYRRSRRLRLDLHILGHRKSFSVGRTYSEAGRAAQALHSRVCAGCSLCGGGGRSPTGRAEPAVAVGG